MKQAPAARLLDVALLVDLVDLVDLSGVPTVPHNDHSGGVVSSAGCLRFTRHMCLFQTNSN